MRGILQGVPSDSEACLYQVLEKRQIYHLGTTQFVMASHQPDFSFATPSPDATRTSRAFSGTLKSLLEGDEDDPFVKRALETIALGEQTAAPEPTGRSIAPDFSMSDTRETEGFWAALQSAHKTCSLLSGALARAQSTQGKDEATILADYQALYVTCRSARSSLQPLMGRSSYDPEFGNMPLTRPEEPAFIMVEHTINNVPSSIQDRESSMRFATHASVLSGLLTRFLDQKFVKG